MALASWFEPLRFHVTSDSHYPESEFTMTKYYIGAVLCTIYLLNFTMGIIELPDNLPIVGNLDEFAASAILLRCLRRIRERNQPHSTSDHASAESVPQLKHDASSR